MSEKSVKNIGRASTVETWLSDECNVKIKEPHSETVITADAGCSKHYCAKDIQLHSSSQRKGRK